MDQSFWGVFGALSPIFVAGLAGVASVVNAWRARCVEQSSVRAALLAEVSALAEIIRSRKYVEALDEAAAYLEVVGEAQTYGITVRVPDHYCRIYSSNPGAVGILKPVQAAKVVAFYQLIDSVVQDVAPGGLLAEGTQDPSAFRESKRLLERALQLADELGNS